MIHMYNMASYLGIMIVQIYYFSCVTHQSFWFLLLLDHYYKYLVLDASLKPLANGLLAIFRRVICKKIKYNNKRIYFIILGYGTCMVLTYESVSTLETKLCLSLPVYSMSNTCNPSS
jgi:hypothetical protein